MKKICPICKAEYLGGEVFCPIDAARLITPSQSGVGGTDSDDPLIGTELDRYRVVRRIGEGGMGLVYEGLHLGIEKRVAIKVLRDDFSSRPEVVERFRQEAKSASRIGHENIVDISDFGQTPSGQSYFVMEFLDGEDLADALAREGTLPVDRVIDITAQCARALAAAHDKGIVHRDMKPENVFLAKRPDGRDFVKIVDFGIAKMSDIETSGAPGRKLTKTGMIFGTPEYMSPEQAAGKGLDHRVDIYALGVIMYELITGRVPFVGDTFMGVLTQHMFETPVPLETANAHVMCTRELELVMFKCLSKDPDDRYATMTDLAKALDEAKEGRVSEGTLAGYRDRDRIPTADPTPSRPALSALVAPPPKKSSAPLWVAGASVLIAGAALTYAFVRPAETETPMAAQTTDEVVDAARDEVVDAGADVPVDEGTEENAAATVVDAGQRANVAVLTVMTTPSGARATVVGNNRLRCDGTPCAIEVPIGQDFVVSARRGTYSGRLEVGPLDADESVQITLRRSTARMGMMGGGMMLGSRPRAGDLKMVDLLE